MPTGYRYDYVVGYGADRELTTARQLARTDAEIQVATENMRLTGQQTTSAQVRERDGVVTQDLAVDIEITQEGMPTTISGWRNAGYYEGRESGTSNTAVWALYRYQKRSGIRQPPGRSSFVLKNVILPGWGQRTMGASGRANFYNLTYLGSWAGWAGLGHLWNIENRKVSESNTIDERDQAADRRNLYGDIRNGFVGVAVATWVSALLDSFSSEPQFLPFTIGPTVDGDGFGISIPFSGP